MNSLSTRVVIVDDELQFLKLFSDVAKSAGFETDTFSNPNDFWLQNYRETDVLILDLSMPDCDGIEFIRELARRECKIQIVLCSGQDKSIIKAAKDLVIAHNLNFLDALHKPISVKAFRNLLVDTKHVWQDRASSKIEFSVSKDIIEKAVENGEITAFYQPQIDLRTGQLLGFEALCRWRSPLHGLVPPNLFLPIAKAGGLMSQITQLMLHHSTQEIANLNLLLDENFHVSVNIDASDASRLDFPEFIEEVLINSKLRPEHLMLEVTESGMMKEMTNSLDILSRLRMKGVNLSIDDFGTGYSSLSMLHQMPFNELKIDQSFVKTLSTDKTSLAIVETSILLARKIGVMTVAEGIEDQDTWEKLSDMGCNIGQGYFIGKPMPFSELTTWYRAWQQQFQKAS